MSHTVKRIRETRTPTHFTVVTVALSLPLTHAVKHLQRPLCLMSLHLRECKSCKEQNIPILPSREAYATFQCNYLYLCPFYTTNVMMTTESSNIVYLHYERMHEIILTILTFLNKTKRECISPSFVLNTSKKIVFLFGVFLFCWGFFHVPLIAHFFYLPIFSFFCGY